MNNSLIQYYRCPESYVKIAQKGDLSKNSGYFRFGADLVCYGQCSGLLPSNSPRSTMGDAHSGMSSDGGTIYLPFDVDQVVDSLRYERYQKGSEGNTSMQAITTSAYYFVRPLL